MILNVIYVHQIHIHYQKTNIIARIWTVCDLGWYITENATKSINRNCSKCMNGYFTSNINEYECKLWTVCDEGTYISRNGTDINDVECDICPSNTYTLSKNEYYCKNVDRM